MEAAFSALIGFVIGAIFAVVNHLLLLSAFKKLTMENQAGDTKLITRVYIIRYIINLAVLCAVFLLREQLPYKWEYILIFTAIGLAVPARILAMKSGLTEKLANQVGGSKPGSPQADGKATVEKTEAAQKEKNL